MLKDKLSNCIKLIFVIATASTLFSCRSQGVNLETLDPNLYDQSWLTEKPCGAPCWYGLEPGVSSREDLISKVKQLSFINGNSATTDSVGTRFLYKKTQSDSVVSMGFENGILEFLAFVPNYQIIFEQAVEKLGSPDGFSVEPMYPDAAGCELQVWWKNKKLVLSYWTGIISIFTFGQSLNNKLCGNEGNLPLPKGILIQGVNIFLPSEIESIMRTNPFGSWKGFAN
jgi:hypothetical protein